MPNLIGEICYTCAPNFESGWRPFPVHGPRGPRAAPGRVGEGLDDALVLEEAVEGRMDGPEGGVGGGGRLDLLAGRPGRRAEDGHEGVVVVVGQLENPVAEPGRE